MPMRNAAPYVLAAISSVLVEHGVPIELIVIDDGSTDGSSEIVASISDPRIRIIPGPQKGITACLNTGLSHATGDIVMRCDADDLYPVGRIKRQADFLDTRPEVIAVCGGFSMIDTEGITLAEPHGVGTNSGLVDISAELIDGDLRTHLCTFGIRRSATIFNNGFREYFETAEDIDFALRLGALGSVIFFSDIAYLYRIHGHSITHVTPSKRRIFFDDQAKQFALQRRDSGADDLMKGVAALPPSNNNDSPHGADLHTLELMTGRAWHLYRSGENRKSIAVAIRVIRKFPNHLASWNLLFRILIKNINYSNG